jgi:glycosyltransferase involved in cell wall biosynthesis
MDKPLRILSIVNFPWDPRLGAARVYVELAEQWKTAGHNVEKFCLTDAFPKPTKSRGLSTLRQVLFPYQAARYIRHNSSRFDVIDALIGTLPFPKKNLRFDGLLVARSVGLHRSYDRFIRSSRKRWPDQPRGKFLGRLFYKLIGRRLHRNCERALGCCDLVNLLNEDEIPFLENPPRIRKPAIVQPDGLGERDRAALASAIQPPEVRLGGKEICFIGMWGLRKGARDWPEIIRRIRNQTPDVQFKFLGTMTDEQIVLNDLHLARADGVRCIPTYDPKQLPSLLGSCAVGLFPSYIEGFGLAVLEQLACGIPTIAYDVAGPRQILKPLRTTLLVPEGNATAMADRAVEILRMNASDYDALSARCRSVADQFRWEQIAAETAQQYRAALQKLRHPIL